MKATVARRIKEPEHDVSIEENSDLREQYSIPLVQWCVTSDDSRKGMMTITIAITAVSESLQLSRRVLKEVAFYEFDRQLLTPIHSPL